MFELICSRQQHILHVGVTVGLPTALLAQGGKSLRYEIRSCNQGSLYHVFMQAAGVRYANFTVWIYEHDASNWV